MDVFISKVPPNANKIHFENFLRGVLAKLGITTFECRKDHKKNFAIITFLRIIEGQIFLRQHGGVTPQQILRYLSSSLQCKPGNKQPPDKWTLKSLEMQEKKSQEKNHHQQSAKPPESSQSRRLQSFSLSCGTWDYDGDYDGAPPIFTAHAEWSKDWTVRFGKRDLTISVGRQEYRLEIGYSSIQGITVQSDSKPSMTLTLQTAPIMSVGKSDLVLHMEGINIVPGKRQFESKPSRVCFLSPEHEPIVSTCLVYRLSLKESISQTQMTELLRNKDVYPAIFRHTKVQSPRNSYASTLRALVSSLANPPYRHLPFGVKFQVQKLVNNGFLQPEFVRGLLPEIAEMVERSGGEVAALAVRKLFIYDQIPYAGPGTDVSDLSYSTIVSLLKKNEEEAVKELLLETPGGEKSDNVAIIYRATVTPAGVYLAGPEPEVNNRVLRKYSKHLDNFLRVTFAEEDCSQQVRFNPKLLNDRIFEGRFVNILQQGIDIAGKRFSFLGFSHSSLRAQSCWFMSPFVENGTLMLHHIVIAGLGDFSHIRSPAKCAARIGQAFSDTREVVFLDPQFVIKMKDVEVNGRVFSDGCGTFSAEYLDYIRKSLSFGEANSATCFQIRYKGAKGMLSLDSRLEGKVVRIRPSMIKFDGTDKNDNNIEICNSSAKPLRMYLNRQLIKLLEDCGVEEAWFRSLQYKAVRELQFATQKVASAAQFLESRHTGGSFYLSWFLKRLDAFGMPFQEDNFLKDVIEMMVIVELRNLKHRSRIPVEKGYTLYGIMDETGLLEEDEVFVITSPESGKGRSKVLVKDKVIVTRSPALHPGDVQLVKAVDVPSKHPLRQLSNCICFSQKGNRDLPSKLSGGDLDGDFYHIIHDPDAVLKRTFEAADYPRAQAINIGRTVTKEDMIKFFVTFMATDQLGRIATLHQVLADMENEGTLSSICLKLSDLHSTAVDYSKTGIPVNLSQLPRVRYRPDFMAPGPHVVVGSKGDIMLDSPPEHLESPENDEEDDSFDQKYYESNKVLGLLYRDIDEKKIFQDVQRQLSTHSRILKRDFVEEVWQLVQVRCHGVNWMQHKEWAEDVRCWYENEVMSIMTEYAPSHRHPLREKEVFIGQIVGKTTAQNKRNRDLSTSMKERFDKVAAETVKYIIKDETEFADDFKLEKSMACLWIALTPGQKTSKGDSLISFKYISASLCLKEAERAFGPLR